jgi:exosortase/archaeosortase family protein
MSAEKTTKADEINPGATEGEGPRTARPDRPATSADARWAQIRFGLTFAIVGGVLSFAYYYPYRPGSAADVLLAKYLQAYAHCAGAVLARFDSSVSVTGIDVGGRFPLRITRDCDGMQINILFAAAILAFPASWRQRALGLGLGLAALLTLNVVRLCTLYFVGVFWPSGFDFAHRELWPMLFIVAAMGAFIGWAGTLKPTEPAGS